MGKYLIKKLARRLLKIIKLFQNFLFNEQNSLDFLTSELTRIELSFGLKVIFCNNNNSSTRTSIIKKPIGLEKSCNFFKKIFPSKNRLFSIYIIRNSIKLLNISTFLKKIAVF